MTDSLYLAWRYLVYNRKKTIILVCCITIIAVLPLALELLLNESERQLAHRAESSPLLIGAKGSALDLVMNNIYFGDEVLETITMAALDQVIDTGLAAPIPMFVRFKARDFPIVGTTLDYFDFRGLNVAHGNMFTMLGQAVIGSEVARKLTLKPGDHIVSSPETLFDIAGIYPLKMKIAGVLAPTNSADDLAVFVDIQTAWVIQGLGHGHKDVTRTTDSSVIHKKEKGNVTANAKLMQYTEITEDNIDSFHLHGDSLNFPITAVLALPDDEKAGTILQGRYLEKEIPYQIVKPREVIDTLMATIFKIRNVLDAVIMLVGSATLLALILVFSLSLRLREKEIEVIYKLGCSKATITRLLSAELLIIIMISSIFCGGVLLLVSGFDQSLVRALFI
jgi:putative ABC transport system permease protein